MSEFDISDLNADISEEVITTIGRLTVSWASYDAALTFWFSTAFGLSLEVCSIVAGHMPSDTKLAKLQTLNEHFGLTDRAQAIKKIRAEHEKHVQIRNAVSHRRCVGTM